MSYDSWLEAPYQEMYAEEERLACPQCDEQMDEDEQGVQCPECGFEDGPDEPDSDDMREMRREQEEDFGREEYA